MKYTNNSCRATTVNVLDRPSWHIMSVTGHKCESSLKTYSGQTNRATSKTMSVKIAEKIKGTSSANTINYCEDVNIENIDLQNLAPLTNSQSNELMDDIQDFVQDSDNMDNILMTIDTQKMSQSIVKANEVSNSNRVMNVQKRQMANMPVPIFNNCSNITINYKF